MNTAMVRNPSISPLTVTPLLAHTMLTLCHIHAPLCLAQDHRATAFHGTRSVKIHPPSSASCTNRSSTARGLWRG